MRYIFIFFHARWANQRSESITVLISVFKDIADTKPELNASRNGRIVTALRYLSKPLLRLNAEYTSKRDLSIHFVDQSALSSSIMRSFKSETNVRSFYAFCSNAQKFKTNLIGKDQLIFICSLLH